MTDNITLINITSSMRDTASEKSKKMGVLRHSIAKGKGNMYGFLGEGLFKQYASPFYKVETHNTYDYDFLVNGDIRIDVKTKSTGVRPLSYYDCSVAEYNTKQKCDVYVFTRILYSLKKLWIVGWLPKQEYFNESTFLKKGSLDEDNGYEVKASCYNLKINKLNLMENL